MIDLGPWAAAAQRVDRRFELQEVLIRGRLALVGIDQLTGGLDEPGDTLLATNRLLLGEHPITLVDAKESVYAQHPR